MADDDRNLPSMAHTLNTAMAHDLPVHGATVKGIGFAGKIKRQVLQEGWKYDAKIKGRSPIIVHFEDGSVIRLDDMGELRLGT